MILRKLISCCICALGLCTVLFADPDTDLYNAIKVQNLGRVQNALRAGANPNQCMANNGGDTNFEYAIKQGNVQIVETMLKDAYVPVAINGNETSKPPLFIAVEKNNDKILEILIKNNANVNIAYNGISLLMYAAQLQMVDMINKIFVLAKKSGQKVDVEYGDSERRTALFYAAAGKDLAGFRGGDQKTFITLLEYSNALATDINGDTVLHYICRANRDDLINDYLDKYSSSARNVFLQQDKDGWTPITYYLASIINKGFSSNFNLKTVNRVINIAGTDFSAFVFPDSGKNGLFELCVANPEEACMLFRTIKDKKIKEGLATIKTQDQIPLLCFAVSEGWNPELVDFLISTTNSDWKKIRWPAAGGGKYKGMNAIEIAQKAKTLDLYQDIFDDNN